MLLEYRGAVRTGQHTIDTNITDFEIVDGSGGPRLVSASGPEGGIVTYSLSDGGLPQVVDTATYDAGSVSGAGINLIVRGEGGDAEVFIAGVHGSGLRSYSLTLGGNIGAGRNVSGEALPLISEAGADRIAIADPEGSGFVVYTVTGSGNLSDERVVADRSSTHADSIGAMAYATSGGEEYSYRGEPVRIRCDRL